MTIPFDTFADPAKYGLEECSHCNGYGSSLKDPESQRHCSKCSGEGLTKIQGKEVEKGRVDYNGRPVPDVCPSCGKELELTVCKSAAGHYLGSWCNCGPYSRESGYFGTREEAEAALKKVLEDTHDS